MDEEIYEKITKRKQFSQLREIDVEIAWKHFEKRQTTLEEKIKLTRDLLRKTFTMFGSKQFLKIKPFDAGWVLKKHLSTKDRFEFYSKIYSKIFSKLKNKATLFDLGAGVNGFSYQYLPKKTSYVGIESVGQLVDLTNLYFKTNKIVEGKMVHLSLFELKEIKELIKKTKGPKIVFLLKVLDSLEILERDYSKVFLKEIGGLVDKIVISFATKSLFKKTKFKVNRTWILNFIMENFHLIEEFETGDEKYIVFSKKQNF